MICTFLNDIYDYVFQYHFVVGGLFPRVYVSLKKKKREDCCCYNLDGAMYRPYHDWLMQLLIVRCDRVRLPMHPSCDCDLTFYDGIIVSTLRTFSLVAVASCIRLRLIQAVAVEMLTTLPIDCVRSGAPCCSCCYCYLVYELLMYVLIF